LTCEGGDGAAFASFCRTYAVQFQFLLFLCCFGLPLAAFANELTPLRVGATREASGGALLIAIDAGYFKAEGFDAKLVAFENDAAVEAAVTSGKADIGMTALSAPFFDDAAAHRLRIVASRSSDQTGFPMYVLLVSQKARAAGLSGLQGLTNAKIAIARTDAASSEYYALFRIASRFELKEESIHTLVLNSRADELAALSRGAVDAALLPYPTALALASKGRSIMRLSNFVQWQQGVVFAAADTLDRRSLIEGFMRAYQRGTAEYALNFQNYDDGGDFIPGPNYDRYLDLIARHAKISPDLLAKTKTYVDRRANLDAPDIRRQVEFWQERGKLDRSISAGDLLELSFIGEEAGARASVNP
jgi:NitT/TauT family transport system substrate-binding protein